MAGALVAGQAQQARTEQTNPAAAYRIGSYLVLVDAVVTDKHNRPVLDLSPKDFIVYEDEVLQPLDSAKLIAPDEAQPAAGTAEKRSRIVDSTAPAATAQEIPPVVLLLDYATTELQNQGFVRTAAKRYFRKRMAPGQQVAVVRVGLGIKLLQDFTDDPEKIVAALDHQDPTGTTYAGDREFLKGAIEDAGAQQASLMQQISSMVNGPNSSDPRAGLRYAILTLRLGQAQRQESRAYAYQAQANVQQSRPILEALRAVVDGLAPLPGRKTLVLISEGFSIPGELEDALYSLVHAANRARVSIYALDSNGLQYKPANMTGELHRDIGALQTGDRTRAEFGQTLFDRARQVGSDQQDSTLRFLASATGGLLIRNTNDFEHALERIGQDSRSYYLLAYRPRNTVFNGEFRRIRVTVNRPGVEVRARSGYVALPPGASALSPGEFQMLAAAARGPEARDFPLYVEPAVFLKDSSYLVDLPIELPLRAAGLAGPVQVIGLVRDSAGEIVHSFRHPDGPLRLDGQSTPDNGWLFTSRLELPPGTYSVEALAMDAASGRRSYRRSSLHLQPVEKALSASGIALSHYVENARAGEASPWNVGAVRVFPTAERHFHSRQNLIFYFNVYYPALEAASGHAEVEVSLSLERNGRRVALSLPTYRLSEVEPSPVPHMQVARYVGLPALPPGPYLLRARVFDHVSGGSVTTQASFELVP